MSKEHMTNPSASEESFRKLESNPDFLDLYLDLVALYLDAAFDDPAAAEVERWTLSCLPATNGGARAFTLNIGPMEVLYAAAPPETEDELARMWARVYVSTSALEDCTQLPVAGLSQKYSALTFEPCRLASADGDATVIGLWILDDESIEQFTTLLDDLRPIRALADRLEARGKGPYEQYHNRWFAQAVLERLQEVADAALDNEN